MNALWHPAWTSRAINPRTFIVSSGLILGAVVALSADVRPAGSSPRSASPVLDRAAAQAAFVPNRGQSDQAVRFELRTPAATLFLTPRKVVLVRPGNSITQRFIAASPDTRLTALGRLPGVVNDFRGTDASRWRSGLPRYAGVSYRGLYPGIVVRYDLRSAATYTVQPGADAQRIGWSYDGVESLAVEPGGALRLTPRGTTGSILVDPPLVAWQQVGGRSVSVPVRYRIGPDRTVGLALGRYDRSRALLIAPTRSGKLQATSRVTYSTYLGGSKWDEAFDVKADRAGDAYVTGFTFSPDFPTANPRQPAFAGLVDAFVTKLSPDGRSLLFSTYLGGTKTDYAQGIALDRSGNAYVTGRTESEDFPTTPGVIKARLGGPGDRQCQQARNHEPASPCHDAFVTKLSPTGSILYSTYFGGTKDEEALGIGVDREQNAVIVGNTESDDLPTKDAVQPTFAPLPCLAQAPCPSDIFITKLNETGSAIVYSTYFGGKMSERAGTIAVDRQGNAYVIGTTRSRTADGFRTLNAAQPQLNGNEARLECGPPPVQCTDAFVLKLNDDGRLVYSTFLGGGKTETGSGIAADRHGNAYVTGGTQSADFPTLNPFRATPDNSACSPPGVGPELCDDVFVTKYGPTGAKLYGTYISGRADDSGLSIAVDRDGSAYVTGTTSSRNYPQVHPTQAFGGYIDAFVTQLAPTGNALEFSTFLGGRKADRGTGIAVGGNADRATFVTGRTISADFPTTPGVVQPALRGDIDAFVTRYN